MGLPTVIKRFLASVLVLASVVSAHAYWQSRTQISIASPAGYIGPGDITTFSVWWGFRAYTLASAGTKSANICNALDAVCADINTLANGNFDIASATGGSLLCGSVGGTCTVKTLYDKTGNNLCTGSVACDITQATIGNRPTLVLSCLGSLPCLGWTSGQSLQSLGVTSGINQPYSGYGVAQRTGSTSAFADVTGSGAFGAVQLGFGNAPDTAFIFSGNVATKSSVTDNTFHSVITVVNGASSILHVDGSSSTVNAGGGNIGTNDAWCMGNCGNGLDGQSTEAGWKAADITSSLSALNSNIHVYWGF